MNRRIILKLTFVFAVATMIFLLPTLAPQAHSQQGCASLRLLGHGVLPTNHPNAGTDTWGGDVWGMLGDELVIGSFSGNDGTFFNHQGSTQARNGRYYFILGGDTLTFEVAQATFNFPPGKAGFGEYRGHATIVEGTGKFKYASGRMDWGGPFFVWSPDETNYYGRFNPTITGTICGISAQ